MKPKIEKLGNGWIIKFHGHIFFTTPWDTFEVAASNLLRLPVA